MSRLTVGVIGAAAALAVVAGGSSAWTTVRGVRQVAQRGLEEAKPDVQQAAELRVLLGDLEEEIARQADSVSDVEDRTSDARREAEVIERGLERERGILRRAKGLLDEEHGQYEIGGRTYSWTELNGDALARVSRCRQAEARLGQQRALCKRLGSAVTQARSGLSEAQRVHLEKSGELVALEARLQNAQLLAQVSELTETLRRGPLGPRTELARRFAEFRRRVRSAERDAGQRDASLKDGLVDWQGGETERASDLIAQLLRGEAKSP